MRWLLCAAILGLMACGPAGSTAPAGPRASGPSQTLFRARAAMDAGDHQTAAALVAPFTADAPAGQPPPLDRHDRAEAWRVYGLAMFFLGRYAEARTGFVEYLKLDVDGRLDPALVPPEAVGFFEEVRAVHAAMLRQYRPKPKRSWALNLVPPLGQLQNRQPTKAYLLAGTGAALLVTNLTTYAVLRQWCEPGTNVCHSGDDPRTSQARALRAVNWSSGLLLLGVIGYGIADGFVHYRPAPRASSVSIGLIPSPHGADVVVNARF